jgi:hypothetical protein
MVQRPQQFTGTVPWNREPPVPFWKTDPNETSTLDRIDESVSLGSMKEVMKTIAVFIAEWCGLEPVAG